MLVRERIEQTLDRAGWSGSELARRLGEHRNWVNYRLSGRTEIKADDLPRIAAALDCSPCDFFEPRPAPQETQGDLDRARFPSPNQVFGRTAPRDAIPREGEASEGDDPAAADFTPTPGQRVMQKVLERMRGWSDEDLAAFDQFVEFQRWQAAQREAER